MIYPHAYTFLDLCWAFALGLAIGLGAASWALIRSANRRRDARELREKYGAVVACPWDYVWKDGETVGWRCTACEQTFPLIYDRNKVECRRV